MPDQKPEKDRPRLRRARSLTARALAWALGKITVQAGITVTISLSVTFALVYVVNNYTDLFVGRVESGWEIVGSQTRTDLVVTVSNDLEVESDIRILGSVLQMAGSDCEGEALPPSNTGTICFDQADNTFKASRGGASCVSLKGGRGPRGLTGDAGEQGPTGVAGSEGRAGPKGLEGSVGLKGPEGEKGERGPQGSPGLDGFNCWDLNEDRAPDFFEDRNQDGAVNTRDCQSPPQGTVDGGTVGLAGINCWDTNGDRINNDGEDTNGDGLFDVSDCLGDQGPEGPQGPEGLQGPEGPQGLEGPQGPEGRQGLEGPQGPQGPQGLQGPPGSVTQGTELSGQTECLIMLPVDVQAAAGTANLLGGFCRLAMSDAFFDASAAGLLSVQLTPRNGSLSLYFMIEGGDILVLENAERPGAFDYLVHVIEPAR